MFVHLLITVLISSVATQSGHPEFDPQMQQTVLKEGYLGVVKCVAKGELPLTYTWYNQSDEEITSVKNWDLFTMPSENGSSLIFPDVKESQAGLYLCSATNKHGTASKPYDVIVHPPSGNITRNETAGIVRVKVINITENSVEFYVMTKGDPDSFYIRYIEQLEQNEKWVQIKKGHKAVVTDLVPGGLYQFQFQIEPPLEVKRPATIYNVTLLPAVPDVIFRNIKDGFVEVEWFLSMDDIHRHTFEEYELSYNTISQFQGRTWEASDCVITIKIPGRNCAPARYTIAGLQRETYYEIRLRVRTSAGFGKPYVNKIYTL